MLNAQVRVCCAEPYPGVKMQLPKESYEIHACKHCFGHLTTEIVPNNRNEIGSRHYMSAEISSPSPPVLGIFRFHKTWVGISMTHSPVIHLSLLYLWHCHKRLKIKIFFFFLFLKRWIHHFKPNAFVWHPFRHWVHPQCRGRAHQHQSFSPELHLLQTFVHAKPDVQRDHRISMSWSYRGFLQINIL